jgi:hypothetical protein
MQARKDTKDATSWRQPVNRIKQQRGKAGGTRPKTARKVSQLAAAKGKKRAANRRRRAGKRRLRLVRLNKTIAIQNSAA